MGEGECETVEASKKGRHRKKQLYNSILQQMEFYFSDSNLSKDRFLSKLISENPYVDIKIFLNFNKIRKLSCTVEDICKAISKSELIELSEDKEKIRRKKPVQIKENVEECTIYVENIKADANHEWLSQVFSEFGNVVYVSIPKYKQNKGNKGFAFVEFEMEKEAENALTYFESIGCKMPSETNPEDLRSIATFEEDNLKHENLKETESIDLKSTEAKDEIGNKKKRKLSEEDDKQGKKVKITEAVETDGKLENKNESLETEDGENKKKKKHKKDKKKNFIKELGLQILSKKEWKKMRNRYLDLQRKKMKEFKQYLHKQKFNQKSYIDRSKTTKDRESQPAEEKTKEEVPSKLEFIPGVIVKLKLPEPCVDVKKIKGEIKAISSDVQYVDIPLPAGSEEIYVRFANSAGAREFCHHEFIGEKTILENEEETAYWNKIQNDRNVKFTKSVKRQRGRDKLLRKAEKERAKHIRFDEGD